MSSIDDALRAIRENKPRKVVFFTGAGISADSGIPTFRGPDGLWRNFRAEDLATPDAFRRDPALVWEWYEWRRGLIRNAQPNAAHHAIARLSDAIVVTQNVDSLHTRAGATDIARTGAPGIVELHGNIFRVRCTKEQNVETREEPFAEIPPHCACGALLRPDVVWFGETLPDEAVARAVSAIRTADLLVVVGTSGVVYPAAGFVRLHHGLSIEINPEASALSSACTFAIAAKAAAATPILVEAIQEACR
jgi:NAD-dependent deacetylase